MDNSIFRKKSIERISSPEQLNDYVRVANPGVWMILSAIILLLVGVCAWGIFGHLDAVVNVGVLVDESDGAVAYINETAIESISAGDTVNIAGSEYRISEISKKPVQVDQDMDPYLLHEGGLNSEDWVYKASLVADDLDEGIYKGIISTESISPISFVLN